MGALDKFRGSGKLFWESSRRTISKLGDVYLYEKQHYVDLLTKYYEKYSIDIFDEENIKELLNSYNFYNVGIYKSSELYHELKEIQRNSENYVIDYLSYKNCLKSYYKIHGKDTEWLVKIFAERYDLDRFNIAPEDVLDDLHELMGAGAELPSLKKNSSSVLKHEEYRCSTSSTTDTSKSMEKTIPKSNTTDVKKSISQSKSYKEILKEHYEKYGKQVFHQDIFEKLKIITKKEGYVLLNDLRAINLLDETILFREVNNMRVKFSYTIQFDDKCQDIDTICSVFMSDNAIKSAMNDSVIMNMEQNIQGKRVRSSGKEDYDKSIESNILFEMYKYSYLMNTIIALENHKEDIIKVDFPSYWSMVQNECMVHVKNLEQEKRKYPAIKEVLQKYKKDTRTVSMRLLPQINARENDYIIAGLMTNVLSTMLYSIFRGATIQLDNSSSQKKIMQIIQKYPSKKVCRIIDNYILNTVILRTSIYGVAENSLG